MAVGDNFQSMTTPDRINGWKAIGNYLGKERTTVMRWEAERALPVHRIPGGKQAAVYAVPAELDDWIRQARSDAEPAETAPVSSAPGTPSIASRFRSRWGGIALTLLVTAIPAGFAALQPMRVSEVTAPQDPMLAIADKPQLVRLYLGAREDWARRDAQSLNRAIGSLQSLVRAAPDFAPGHAALAESWLLAREFGQVDDRKAFTEAEAAAQEALRLDPRLHTALRAQGFVDYWWHRRPAESGRRFREAIRLVPGDAQSHFWYGNILSDNGQAALAIKNFERAMTLQPGVLAMRVDYAWTHWEAGNEDRARSLLREIEPEAGDSAVYHAVLSDAALAAGDWQGHAEHYNAFAQLRNEPTLLAHAARMLNAARQGDAAIAEAAYANAVSDADSSVAGDHSFVALIAATRGDRATLLDVLRDAQSRGEKWGSAGYRLRIANRYGGDAEIMTLLDSLRAEAVE